MWICFDVEDWCIKIVRAYGVPWYVARIPIVLENENTGTAAKTLNDSARQFSLEAKFTYENIERKIPDNVVISKVESGTSANKMKYHYWMNEDGSGWK